MLEPEKIITFVLEQLSGRFGDDTEANVSDLLTAGEPGVALEVLCAQILEFEVEISKELKEQLALAAEIMEIKIEDLSRI